MKKFLSIIAVLTVVFSLVACTSEPKEPVVEATDKLVVYTPNSEGIINAVIPLFEQTYGVEVELIQAGTGELMTRLQSEAGAPYADVMFGGSKSQFAANPDIFQEYVSENDQYVIEAYRNTSGYMSSYVLDGSVLVVNTDLIGDIEIIDYSNKKYVNEGMDKMKHLFNALDSKKKIERNSLNETDILKSMVSKTKSIAIMEQLAYTLKEYDLKESDLKMIYAFIGK